MHSLNPFALAVFQLLLCGLAVMSDSTPALCYHDVNQLAPEYIVPCWPSNRMPHYSCCKIGSKCLKHNACYDGATGVTYQYGCTDATYIDPSCPSKCGLNRQKSKWVGMVYCDGTHNWPNTTWVCHHPDNCKYCGDHTPWDEHVERLSDTNCGDLKHEGSYVAFNEVSTLPDTVPIPQSTDIAKYFSLNEDRWKSTSTSGSTGGATTTSAPQNSESTLLPGPSATGAAGASPTPSRAHTVAVAIGFGAGIPTILAVVAILLWYWRKHRSQASREEPTDESPGEGKYAGPQSDNGVYGYVNKAELPGGDVPVHSPAGSPSQAVEMEGSTIGERTPLSSPFVSPLLSQASYNRDSRELRISGIYTSQRLPQELPG